MKKYFIQLRGFDGHMVEAESAGQARYREYQLWKEAFNQKVTFGEFIKSGRIEIFHHHGAVR